MGPSGQHIRDHAALAPRFWPGAQDREGKGGQESREPLARVQKEHRRLCLLARRQVRWCHLGGWLSEGDRRISRTAGGLLRVLFRLADLYRLVTGWQVHFDWGTRRSLDNILALGTTRRRAVSRPFLLCHVCGV